LIVAVKLIPGVTGVADSIGWSTGATVERNRGAFGASQVVGRKLRANAAPKYWYTVYTASE